MHTAEINPPECGVIWKRKTSRRETRLRMIYCGSCEQPMRKTEKDAIVYYSLFKQSNFDQRSIGWVDDRK